MRPVMDYLDHQMMNDIKPFDTVNPSAENLAKYFYDETNKYLAGQHQGPRAGEGRHHLGDGYDDGDVLRVARFCRTGVLRLCILRGRFAQDDRGPCNSQCRSRKFIKSLQGESSYAGMPVHLRAPDGMQPALLVVRQRVHLHGRTQDDAGRG